MNEAKMNELTQAEDMAYFRADLCCYSPESYTLEVRTARSSVHDSAYCRCTVPRCGGAAPMS